MNTTQKLSNSVSVNYLYVLINKQETQAKTLENIFTQIKEYRKFNLGEYTSEEKLLVDLDRKIFGKSDFNKLKPFTTIDQEKIKNILENSFSKCFDTLNIKNDITIYVIPFCNEESSRDLNGVNAFPTEGNILYLFIDTSHPDWASSLVETIPHEYAHLIYTSKFEWNSILDGFVNEGLAEKFREMLVGGKIAPWANALTKEEALKELSAIPLNEILNLRIDDSNVDLYIAHFFGTGELPNWYGYSLGYWLIDEILEKNKISLLDLFKKSPSEIYSLWR